eukprot:GHRQ01036247.1.p1 GENE.GHRQ01036247.1~~GHRQ01036247.1.p1  ORF type:complete len:299 (+),score=90.57 GHRQ01036247.1:201-1097(+)
MQSCIGRTAGTSGLAKHSRPNRAQCVAVKAVAEPQKPATQPGRRAMLGMAGLALLASSAAAPAQAGEPFLASTGGKGLLAEEEERLVNLRIQAEGEARKEIQAEREKLEEEARRSQIGKLCATPYGIDIVGITEFIALVGALVGGITARQRKAELERLNEQLRKINMSLRQQARAGTVYAPGLSYAPPTGSNGNGVAPSNGAAAAEPMGMQTATATVTAPRPPAVSNAAAAAAPSAAPVPLTTLFSMDEEEMTSDQIQCRWALALRSAAAVCTCTEAHSRLSVAGRVKESESLRWDDW